MSQRTIAGLVAALLAFLGTTVLLVPVLLRGESPSPLEVVVAAGELLLVGFVLRTRRSERVRSIGFWILVLGLGAVGAGVYLLWRSV